MTQLVQDDRIGGQRAMSIQEAADELGVPYQTWHGWEAKGVGPREEGLVIRLYRMSRGQLRPDHFYPLPDLRAEARERAQALESSTEPDKRSKTDGNCSVSDAQHKLDRPETERRAVA